MKKFNILQLQLRLPPAGLVGGEPDAGLLEHEPGGHAGIGVVVLVAVVDDLGDAGLDDGLGTLVAGEEGDIHPRALEVVVGAVEDGVELRVMSEIIMSIPRCRVSAPIATKITVNPLTNPNAPNKVFLWCVAHRLQNRRYRWAA